MFKLKLKSCNLLKKHRFYDIIHIKILWWNNHWYLVHVIANNIKPIKIKNLNLTFSNAAFN